MQPSPAIRELEMQMFQLLLAKDVAGIMAHVSQQPGTMLFIGSDPSEWFTSYAPIEQMLKDSVQNVSRSMPDDLEIVAFEEGTIGWANLRYTIKLPNGGSCLSRWTDIYHQESGAWKLVGGHASVAVPDDKVMSFFSPS